MLWRSTLIAGVLTLGLTAGCESDTPPVSPPPPAPAANGGSGGATPIDAGLPPTTPVGGAAGAVVSGSGGRGGMGGAAGAPIICKIPNEIMVLQEDADGGLEETCQNVPRKIIANQCIGGYCHDSVGPPSGGLDLMAACVADRLANVKSHCQDMYYIDVAHPENSFISDKLNAVTPRCGNTMPDSGRLLPNDLACMNAWIAAVVRAASSQP